MIYNDTFLLIQKFFVSLFIILDSKAWFRGIFKTLFSRSAGKTDRYYDAHYNFVNIVFPT